MPVRYVSKKQFDAFGPPRIDQTISEEVEWFADDEGVVIGVITWEKSGAKYSIAVLGRDEQGTFHTFDTDTDFKTVDNARRNLFAKMEMALTSGARVFPRRH